MADTALKRIDVLIAKSKKPQVVLPVFKWGQSKTEVFIEIKLSHRFDAPGCLDSISNDDVHKFVKVEQSRGFIFIRMFISTGLFY